MQLCPISMLLRDEWVQNVTYVVFFQFLLHIDLRDSLFYTHEAPKTNDNNLVFETACVNVE